MIGGAALILVLILDKACRLPAWKRCPPAKAGFFLPQYKYIFSIFRQYPDIPYMDDAK